MKLELPHYNGKDYYVMGWVAFPLTLLLNSILLGTLYFGSFLAFTLATIITGLFFCVYYILCSYVAVALQQRLAAESQVPKRLGLMIAAFLILAALFLYSLIHSYEAIDFFGYHYSEEGLIWSYIAMGILNIFITLVQEGISRYEKWRSNLKETDALKTSFRQSQLQGLKSQVNPHFLFNSLNSLSSLISEDEAKAEKFLDEMSKVYRYMLRNDEDQLVTLRTELAFIDSYVYLLKARYGEGLLIEIKVAETARDQQIPPLTLQLIIENTVHQNTINRQSPLKINIHCSAGNIIVHNNVQPKVITETMDHNAGLDNLVNKYRLLNESGVIIEENENERTIRLPLIIKKMEAAI